MDSFVIGGS